MSFQEIIAKLSEYWSEKGCAIIQGYDLEVGAGTFNPSTFLRVLGPEPWNAAYVEPSRRPTDGRYGDNPNRLQHYYQFQVIMKPSPLNVQDLYLDSLRISELFLKNTMSALWKMTGSLRRLALPALDGKSGSMVWRSPSSHIFSNAEHYKGRNENKKHERRGGVSHGRMEHEREQMRCWVKVDACTRRLTFQPVPRLCTFSQNLQERITAAQSTTNTGESLIMSLCVLPFSRSELDVPTLTHQFGHKRK